jgi:rRNA maturation RNase YbeY
LLKNLSVYCEEGIKINKVSVHSFISKLKIFLGLRISSLELNFLHPETIITINKLHLKHNYVTDIISFNYSNESNNLDGEILICLQTARENSKRFKTTYENEVKRLIVHGILHLLGWEDNSLSQRRRMRTEENKILRNIKNVGRITT